MPVNAEQFFGQKHLVQSEMVIKPRLRSPADMEGAGYMGFGPLHDLAKLLPVIYFFKRDLLHRCACDDQTIVFVVLQLIEGIIKLVQMSDGGVHGYMAVHFHKGHIHLQGRVGQRTQQMQLRVLLDRHQVQNTDLQRTHVLMQGPVLVHDKNIFIIQNIPCGKIALYFNRHFFILQVLLMLPPYPDTDA